MMVLTRVKVLKVEIVLIELFSSIETLGKNPLPI